MKLMYLRNIFLIYSIVLEKVRGANKLSRTTSQPNLSHDFGGTAPSIRVPRQQTAVNLKLRVIVT